MFLSNRVKCNRLSGKNEHLQKFTLVRSISHSVLLQNNLSPFKTFLCNAYLRSQLRHAASQRTTYFTRQEWGTTDFSLRKE